MTLKNDQKTPSKKYINYIQFFGHKIPIFLYELVLWYSKKSNPMLFDFEMSRQFYSQSFHSCCPRHSLAMCRCGNYPGSILGYFLTKNLYNFGLCFFVTFQNHLGFPVGFWRSGIFWPKSCRLVKIIIQFFGQEIP